MFESLISERSFVDWCIYPWPLAIRCGGVGPYDQMLSVSDEEEGPMASISKIWYRRLPKRGEEAAEWGTVAYTAAVDAKGGLA